MTKRFEDKVILVIDGTGNIGKVAVKLFYEEGGKGAVIGLTKSAAKEVGKDNIRVNSVHPSPVDNEMMRGIESGYDSNNPEAVKEAQTQLIPLGRYAVEEDVANVVAFLASDDSAFVTGSEYRIDGGMMS